MFSQGGKIVLNSKQSNDTVKYFNYYPLKMVSIGDEAYVDYILSDYGKGSAKLNKGGESYNFSLKVPSEIKYTIFRVLDSNGNVLDNNNSEGYYLKLNNNFTSKDEVDALFFRYMASRTYGYNTGEDFYVEEYEKLLKQYSELKNSTSYSAYLRFKYKPEDEALKKEIIAYAKQQENLATEDAYSNAYTAYSLLKMPEDCKRIEKMSAEKFPEGSFAIRNFVRTFASNENKDEQYIDETIIEFNKRFPNIKQDEKDYWIYFFNGTLLNKALADGNFVEVKKILAKLPNQGSAMMDINNFAWGLTGGGFTSDAKDLDFAEKISQLTVDSATKNLENNKNQGKITTLTDTYNMYADTLALILYKKGKYQEAYNYQDKIRLSNQMGTDGKERYAVYAEKAKGEDFAKQYLENEILNNHVNSPAMFNQLKSIYTKKNLSFDEFEKLNENNLKLVAEKEKEDIIKEYGSLEALDFTLTNLDGKSVKLSDYRGKVVVLDFWATWCGPCRESFPHMKELVEKYNGSNVEFFFVDTWENNKPEDIKKKVSEFITKNQYPFNVLLDYKDEVAKMYKIHGVPSKIVIDKDGNILSMKQYMSDESLVALIEENK